MRLRVSLERRQLRPGGLHQPEKRRSSLIRLGATALVAVAVVFGLRALDAASTSTAGAETIEGVVGLVSPKLLMVGGMNVMVSCADAARCPGVAAGNTTWVAYVADGGPWTDTLAIRI